MNIDYARQKMVEQQVRAWDVLDHDVLAVLADTRREQFAPAGFEALAFADAEIPIGHGEMTMTPTIEGRLLQALALKGNENILEVGTGCGFVTACLANLGRHVTSIDIHDDFLERADQVLSDNGINNYELLRMDATQSLPPGKFDAIAVTGSLQQFDPRFVESLATGGRLFVVVGDAPVMDARLVERTAESDWESESLFETQLRPLVNASLPPRFSF